MTDEKHRWQRLGYECTNLASYGRHLNQTRSRREQWVQGGNVQAQREFAQMDYFLDACLNHLQLDSWDYSGILALERVHELSVEYFFGEWIKEWRSRFPSLIAPRSEQLWVDTYRESILAALCIDADVNLAKLITWPDQDLSFDEGTFRLTKDDNRFLILLSFVLGDSNNEQQRELRQYIRDGRGRRAKLLLTALEAIEAGDRQAFRKGLLDVAKYHREREFRDDHPFQAIMIEGSMLWHIARRRGMRLDDLPLDVMDRIIRKETLTPPG